jgi:16S rRNA (cytosine1402-N4)-methyltransferase
LGTNFYHEPVLLHETVDLMEIKPDGVYVDVTFGGGGHSREILSRLSEKGRLYVLDQDTDAIRNVPDDERVTFIHSNFRYVRQMLRVEGVSCIDGLLADLGVSSWQFDTATRGFSYRMDGPLDMRMNIESAVTAYDVIMRYSEDRLQQVFSEYGEVRNAKTLARHIIQNRERLRPVKTTEFLQLIEPVIFGNRQKYLAQVFQSLRIEVNQEMEVIRQLLIETVKVLKVGGVMAMITFHSLEDRLVKNFFKTGNFDGILARDKYGNIQKPLEAINKKPVEASEDEIRRNSRARSAKLRAARKL